MNYKEIQELIKLVKKNQISELEIEKDDFKIVIRSQEDESKVIQQVVQAPPVQAIAAAPVQAAAPVAQPVPAEAPVKEESNFIEVKSPMIGTFYRAPGPDKDPYVSIGDVINVGQTICMIEAMKLFNEIEAEITGKIVKILVEDATPVEFDQPLFLVDPKG